MAARREPAWLRQAAGVARWDRSRSSGWAQRAESEIGRRAATPRRLRRQLRDLDVIARSYARRAGDPVVLRELDRARVAIEDRLARYGHLSEGYGELMAAPPLVPGRSPLGQYGIDEYGTFGNRPGDSLQGHELLQNLWLEVHGYGRRLTSPASRTNPAVALSHDEHVAVGRQQRAMGLYDPANLRPMSAPAIIDANVEAMRRAGVRPEVIEVLRREALRHAASLPPPPRRRARAAAGGARTAAPAAVRRRAATTARSPGRARPPRRPGR